jgi:hypothetical protein
MKSFVLFLFVFVSTGLFFPVKTSAFYCACCAEPGTYSISVKKPDAYERGELERIRFSDANLFMTAAGEDNIKGLSPIGENYTVDGLFLKNSWKFSFKDEKGKTGTLALPMPATMVAFAADIHDREGESAAEPVLYKELRFKYKVQNGSGIFQKGIAPATEYFLVLQGRGNNCTSAADFTHWRLEITGKKASYAFFGKLK